MKVYYVTGHGNMLHVEKGDTGIEDLLPGICFSYEKAMESVYGYLSCCILDYAKAIGETKICQSICSKEIFEWGLEHGIIKTPDYPVYDFNIIRDPEDKDKPLIFEYREAGRDGLGNGFAYERIIITPAEVDFGKNVIFEWRQEEK